MKQYKVRNKRSLVHIPVFVILLLSLAAPVFANSVVDDAGVTWTATREYNSSSGGYDIKVVTDETPVSTYWVTSDSSGDEDPHIAINPDTDYPVVVWSKSVMGGNRIRISWYGGSDFGSPQTVTSGGTQYGDETPHMALESDGDIHLVFLRDHMSSDGEAIYMSYTGTWSSPTVYSISGDNVIGSCVLKLIDEDDGILESDYLYDVSSKRERCKGGNNDPWSTCQ